MISRKFLPLGGVESKSEIVKTIHEKCSLKSSIIICDSNNENLVIRHKMLEQSLDK
jgi:hypothetical protein